MHVVAIYNLKKDKESLAGVLASSLGLTIYEALSRLRSPGNGPLTVAVFVDEVRAGQLAERLQAAGFTALVLSEGEIGREDHSGMVRRFSLGERELSVTTQKGDSIDIPFQKVELILRGTAIIRDVATETVKNRAISPGRAVLSGGLMITKTTTNIREVVTEERQGFMNLYSGDSSPLIFHENRLAYDSLGSEMRLSRATNFTYLIAELRRRCPGTLYDERLLTRAGQVALLGPSLDPEKYLSVATALLQKVLCNKTG